MVDSSSMFRTDVLTNDNPEWPIPTSIKRRIKCKPKEVVLDGMFMRTGNRDPLDGSIASADLWTDKVLTR